MTDVLPIARAPIPRLLAGRPLVLRALAVLALSWVMAAGSWAEVPMFPVPMTLQTLALFAIAGLAGMRMTFEVVLVWLAQAALGLPVLAGGASGLEAFAGPTGGYLIGMLVAGPLAGGLAERLPAVRLTAVFLVCHLIVLAFGWAWLAGQVGAAAAWKDGVSPFLMGALVKSVLAAGVVLLAEVALARKRAA
ncbi:biotin transporter BioY [Phenylobacterium sp.]|jgi:biotin transport system substrate-specific component|uniref:biotin transporter BioY n=1 Tax=Phenylobacterium sp. TaxID=1871053 RepID=UPI002F9592D4